MELNDLNEAIRRATAEQAGADRLSQARAKLIIGIDPKSAFFATVALRLQPVQDWTIDTAATDGKALKYNPQFMADLDLGQAVGLVCHESLHITNAHHARRADREMPQWNVACDLAINPIVKECGFSLPEGALFPGEGSYAHLPAGLSAEDYYSQMSASSQPGQQPAPGQGPPQGQGSDPGQCGGVDDPGDGSESAVRQAEAEAKVLAKQAESAAKGRGALPGGLGRTVAEALAPAKVDWRAVLREFVSQLARNDYSWSRPNRRYVAQGLYLPGLHSEELGEIVLAVDVSGSIGPDELKTFAEEVQGILDSYSCSLTIVYHDHAVQQVQQHSSTDGPLVLSTCGGGGTSHVPVFDHVEEQHMQPACLVALTDLCSDFPTREPAYPVLWTTFGAGGRKGPFGRTVAIDA